MSDAPDFIYDQGHMPPPGCIVDMTSAEIDAAERFETGGDPYYQAQAIRGLTFKQAMSLFWRSEKLEFTMTFPALAISVDPLVIPFEVKFGQQYASGSTGTPDEGLIQSVRARPHNRACAPSLNAFLEKYSEEYEISDGEGGWEPGGPFKHLARLAFSLVRVNKIYDFDGAGITPNPLVGPIVRNTTDGTYAVFCSGSVLVSSTGFPGSYFSRTDSSQAVSIGPPLLLTILGHEFTFFVTEPGGSIHTPAFSAITSTSYTITP